MQLNITANQNGQEVLDEFKVKVTSKGIDGGKYVIEVQKSNGDWVEIGPEKLRLSFSKE